MQAVTLILVCVLLAGTPASAAVPAASLTNEALLRSARAWEAHDRADLARLALEKLVAARPDSAQALLELGELNLRMGDMAAAREVLRRLESRFADSAAAGTFAIEYRFATSDRLQLASLQRLLQVGRGAQARKELRRLFPQGAPDGVLGIEYYQLLADTPGGRPRAAMGLRKLAARHADDPRYQLALARALLDSAETKIEAAHLLHSLAARDDVRRAEVDALLASAIKDGQAEVPEQILRSYLERHPHDRHIAAVLQRQSRKLEQQQLLSRNTLAAVEPQLQQRNLRSARNAASLAGGNDSRTNLALAMLQLADGQLPGRDVQIDDAVYAAALWYERSRLSLMEGRVEQAAIQLEASIALRLGRYEAAIVLAERFESLHAAEQAGELLAAASHLDAGSAWLFATLVRWMIDHGRADQALGLLQARPLDDKWTAALRDDLRAAALDRRAQALLEAGATVQAMADLHTAVELVPQHPWTRYRLAGLYARQGAKQRGRQLLEEGVQRAPDDVEMHYALALYLSSIGDAESAHAIVERIEPEHRTEGMNALCERLQRSFRITQADQDLAAGRVEAARDGYAELTAEQPDDLYTRLAYVQALTESGDLELAELQLQAVQEQAQQDDVELQLGIARRQAVLGDETAALQTLQALVAVAPQRADALLFAGRIELARRHYAAAENYFARAARLDDADTASTAWIERERIHSRLASWMEAAIEVRHKPGDAGISRYESSLAPTLWRYARDYEQRFVLRADAVAVDAGRLGDAFDSAALLGTIQAAGPGAVRRYDNGSQSGLSLGVGYETDRFAADLGTTPLGFLLPRIVGGAEWTAKWRSLDVAAGISRRAVTGSVLSYAGLRDPISGVRWGGVVETGPYARVGLYRELYSMAGAIRLTELAGTRVPSNGFSGVRGAADWQVIARQDMQAFTAVAFNYWRYQRNLQNYTFGSGGYYSPQSYLSIALPVELRGIWSGWSYRLRASLAYSTSSIQRVPFYRDPILQSAALNSTLPAGFDEPFFAGGHGGGTSFSAYAAVERQIAPRLVMGAKLDIDRADYYQPTIFMLYLRHVFGAARTEVEVPPRPVKAYVEQ